jgi:hypothetical protein
MSQPQQLLNNLHDIHLPEPVSFWPPAIGWWLLALLVLVGIGLFVWMVRRKKRITWQKTALAQLQQLHASYQKNNKKDEFISALSVLVRRSAIAAHDRRRVANLTGDAWLKFLDNSGNTNIFTNGAGRALAVAPYSPNADIDAGQLKNAVEHWIHNNS